MYVASSSIVVAVIVLVALVVVLVVVVVVKKKVDARRSLSIVTERGVGHAAARARVASVRARQTQQSTPNYGPL